MILVSLSETSNTRAQHIETRGWWCDSASTEVCRSVLKRKGWKEREICLFMFSMRLRVCFWTFSFSSSSYIAIIFSPPIPLSFLLFPPPPPSPRTPISYHTFTFRSSFSSPVSISRISYHISPPPYHHQHPRPLRTPPQHPSAECRRRGPQRPVSMIGPVTLRSFTDRRDWLHLHPQSRLSVRLNIVIHLSIPSVQINVRIRSKTEKNQ